MRIMLIALAAAASLTGSVALAQDVAVKPGAMIVSSDGKRIGRIDRVDSDAAGKPQTASLIYESHFVHLPLSTLTFGENGRVISTLSRKEISALR